MDLKSLIGRYPGVRLAGPSDNEALLRFFGNAPIVGSSLELRIDRSPDFFALLRYQGEDSFVFVYEAPTGDIRGVASLALRDGYVHGQLRRVGYLADLRMQFAREPLRIWRRLFADLLKEPITEFGNCDHWVTAVIDENHSADRALVKAKRGDHRYDLLTPYWMVNVFAKPWPTILAKDALGTRVRHATIEDEDRLRSFLDRESRTQAFGFRFGEELPRRLRTWKGLRIEDFWIAEDHAEEIQVCTAVWSPSAAKRNVIDRLPLSLRVLRPFLPVPHQGEAVRSLYLTHLTFRHELSVLEKESVSGAFLKLYAEKRSPDLHMISFCDFPALKLHACLRDYLKQTIPMSLYVVRSRSSQPEKWSPEELLSPGFEIGLV